MLSTNLPACAATTLMFQMQQQLQCHWSSLPAWGIEQCHFLQLTGDLTSL